ncbi:MAG: nuclear transport factor 2 family protein [Micrococcales bacterium]|nr:nuclear transport factor 2 family protein [Micrococcales bacterium]
MTVIETASLPGAPTPEHLVRQFADRLAVGDIDGLVALYAPDAVVALGEGREAAGTVAIQVAFRAALAAGIDLSVASVTTPIIAGGLACTTSITDSGAVLTQVARLEADGTWRWVRDGHRLRDLATAKPAKPATEPTAVA